MANSVYPDEMAHHEPSHLDLHCLQRYLFWSAGMKGLRVSCWSERTIRTYMQQFSASLYEPVMFECKVGCIGHQKCTVRYMLMAHFDLCLVLLVQSTLSTAGLGGSVGCAVRLETRRSRVQPPPRSATFFRGDWSWNIFYGHSLPSADSRRAVVSFWRKNVHNTG